MRNEMEIVSKVGRSRTRCARMRGLVCECGVQWMILVFTPDGDGG